jgi:hypothetical protein
LQSGWKTPHPKNFKQEFWMLLHLHLYISTRDRPVKQDD